MFASEACALGQIDLFCQNAWSNIPAPSKRGSGQENGSSTAFGTRHCARERERSTFALNQTRALPHAVNRQSKPAADAGKAAASARRAG
jgi:hypothetical protein